jgi:transposase
VSTPKNDDPTARRHVVGIDVSKDRLDVCFLPSGEAFSVTNDPEGIDALVGRLREEPGPELVVLEATGRLAKTR